MKILLINSNTVFPPVEPIGLEYICSFLKKQGMECSIFDLNFKKNWVEELKLTLKKNPPHLVGVNVRNTDNCAYPYPCVYVNTAKEVVKEVKKTMNVPVVLGGSGYSLFPQRILKECEADFGIKGDGEIPMLLLAQSIEKKEVPENVPNLYRKGKEGEIIEPNFIYTYTFKKTGREIHEGFKYYKYGGQTNIETQRGCNGKCSFCADPVIKGKKLRKRESEEVLEEIFTLSQNWLNHIYICDSEFNLSIEHLLGICSGIIRRGLNRKIKWYAYMIPSGFTRDIVSLLKSSGCDGVNFNLPSCDEEMCESYSFSISMEEVEKTCRLFKKFNIPFIFDLLIGGVNERKETIMNTLKFLKKMKPFCVGFAVGVRVYPGTSFGNFVKNKILNKDLKGLYGEIKDNEDFFKPIFYISEHLSFDSICSLIEKEIYGEFPFFLPSAKDKSHDYAGNKFLKRAISRGMKGAYWKMLLKV